MTKKHIGILGAILLVIGTCLPVSATTPDAPLFSPSTRTDGVLESHTVDEYIDEDGFIVTKTTDVYTYPNMKTRSGEEMKTAHSSYSLSAQGEGEIMIVNLDADFYYIKNQLNSVRCPRYYSSYNVKRPDLVVSYEETSMDHPSSATYYKVKTKYLLKFKEGALGAVVSKKPSLWVACSYLGAITFG